ncbi:hypothetical protein [Pseudonocardia sp. HH130630-07]|nr:hypothetical protein [Pseudonocardia sp. HH130630-07]
MDIPPEREIVGGDVITFTPDAGRRQPRVVVDSLRMITDDRNRIDRVGP